MSPGVSDRRTRSADLPAEGTHRDRVTVRPGGGGDGVLPRPTFQFRESQAAPFLGRAFAAVSAAVACAAALTACALVPRPHVFPRAEVRGFVTADGTGFRLDGSPYRFVGVNIYDATATARYACDRRMPSPTPS